MYALYTFTQYCKQSLYLTFCEGCKPTRLISGKKLVGTEFTNQVLRRICGCTRVKQMDKFTEVGQNL